MHNELEAMAQEIQAEADKATREEMGEIFFNRWRNPPHMGGMENPDGTASLHGNCGDTMQLFLRFQNERVNQSSFLTDGCGPSVVSASVAAELAMGKTVEEILEVNPGHILTKAGGLPQDHEHCAFLAADTLHAAAKDYLARKGEE